MDSTLLPGAVIFAGDKNRLARFYEAAAGLQVTHEDSIVTVLASAGFELVIHSLAGETVGDTPNPEREAYVKPFFVVKSLAAARQQAEAFGGRLDPLGAEWEARGFRACEGVDPDGNPIQFRQRAP